MMMTSADDLRQIMPASAARADTFFAPLVASMSEFLINTPRRQAAFIAQIAHESSELRFVSELADGAAYEGRTDLGNTQPGDGPRFKGRGLLQISGRTNYQKCGAALGLDLLAQPSLLTTPENACRSAGWYWSVHGLNTLADTDLFGSITHRVNGGYNGLDQRLAYWIRARKQLGL